MKKVLITGANGQLGRELVKTAPTSWDVAALTRQDLDICQHKKVEKTFSAIKPQVVINAAAYTAVDRAEDEPDKAFAVNAEGAGILAKVATEHNARFIHISTDFVFDGRQPFPYKPDDTPYPPGTYGKSKLEGERKVTRTAKGKAVVIRTSWLYSSYGNNFVKTILRLVKERDKLNVVDDQVGAPTWARGLAETLWKFVSRPELQGIYHWSDAGVASWYDFAMAIQEEAYHLGLISHVIPIYPIRSAQYPLKAPRPFYSVLDSSKTWEDLHITSMHWRVALRDCLKEFNRC